MRSVCASRRSVASCPVREQIGEKIDARPHEGWKLSRHDPTRALADRRRWSSPPLPALALSAEKARTQAEQRIVGPPRLPNGDRDIRIDRCLIARADELI